MACLRSNGKSAHAEASRAARLGPYDSIDKTEICFHPPPAGFYVHSEDAVKSLLALICEQLVFTGDPGIVECVVEPSKGFESEWYDPLHLLGLAEICLDERRRSAVAFDVID